MTARLVEHEHLVAGLDLTGEQVPDRGRKVRALEVADHRHVGRKNLICHVMRQDRTRDVARRVRISR